MRDTDLDMTRGVYRRLYSGATRGRRINSVSISAALLFWHLHMVADDYGTFEADSHLLKCSALPVRDDFTERQISLAMGELSKIGPIPLILLYQVGNEKYGQIAGFLAMQPAGKNGRRIQRFPFPVEKQGLSKAIQNNPGESGGIRLIQEIQASDTTNDTTNDTPSASPILGTPKDSEPAPSQSRRRTTKIGLPIDAPNELRTPEFEAAWTDWQRHRSEIGHPLRPTTEKSQLAQFSEWGTQRAIAAIKNTITKGYQGILEPNANGNGSHGEPKREHKSITQSYAHGKL